MSETSAPVRVSSHKDVIGPGIVYVPNAPRSPTVPYLGQVPGILKSGLSWLPPFPHFMGGEWLFRRYCFARL